MSKGAVGVKVTDAEAEEMPSGSDAPTQPAKALPTSGVAVTVKGVVAEYHAVPEGDTVPPLAATMVPL